MKKYKILNLYACLGGNRYKWDEVTDNLEITAVELDPDLARMYQERFPNDTVIIADAHQYLLDHYKEFNFIWSSPPCPTHSRARFARRNTTTNVQNPNCDEHSEWQADAGSVQLYRRSVFLFGSRVHSVDRFETSPSFPNE